MAAAEGTKVDELFEKKTFLFLFVDVGLFLAL